MNTLADAYKARWARSGQDTPEVLFDKEFRPDTRNISVHILWYACIQGKDYPHVTGYGTTIQDALEDLLSQLYEGPQKWLAKLVVERDAFVSELKQKQMAKDKKHSPVQLATKPSAANAVPTPPSSSLVAPSPPLSAGPPTQVSNINSTGHPAVSKKQGASTDKTAPIPQIAVAGSYQGIKPKADTLFKNLPPWVIGDKTADTKSAGSSDNPGFAFGSGPILSSSGAYTVFSKPLNPAPKFGDGIVPFEFNGSFGKKAVLDEARERQKRKEEDMDSDEDEEDWEKRDAARQARKKAKLLTLTPPSKQTFGTFSQSLQPARITFSLDGGHISSETRLLPPTSSVFSPFGNPNIIGDTDTTTFHTNGPNNAGFFHSSSAFPTPSAPSGMPQTSVENLLSRLPAETEEGRKIRQGLEKTGDYQAEKKIKVEHPDTPASHAGEVGEVKPSSELNFGSSAIIGSRASLFDSHP
ncbi:hypothetical protein D6D13_06996 [Aureobasidium pullulans]|uniref:Uncharacterized protein n=1 Tax=Aureobasidium pullulans TaxID=5580 RepID=A0A4S9CF25_AURPU|nr:hypothetical protein D6D13_06996 [Aureobasidium pullulans]